ncbi:MAG: glycosyltransferase [Candidatus Cloacimonetes bacterium]|nr:glycosyltransferase [Candidatus Cloacimonadota bacterium]
MNPTIYLSVVLIFFTLCMSRLLFKKRFKFQNKNLSVNKFSIVISCRNEAHNLVHLFDSLQKLHYSQSLYEIMFIDDHSTDETFDLLTKFCVKSVNYHAYRLSGISQGKKFALQKGISYAQNDWIVFTDADCIVHCDWLDSIDFMIQKDKLNLISMYIGYSPEERLKSISYLVASFRYFKQLVSAFIYASSTMAGYPFSCTARNLIFKKSVFNTVGGYSEFLNADDNLLNKFSGDDKLLLKKFLGHKQKISYLPYPPIYTKAVNDNSVKNQDLRRYGKFSMSSLLWQIIMLIIGLCLVYIPIEIVFIKQSYPELGLFLFSLVFFSFIGCLVHREKFYLEYIIFSIFFPYYLIYKMIKARFCKWTWKNRRLTI